ncbi:hypothetical protein K6W84_04615 [Burkholderia cepacia]|nr:hypothetical protein [Burkholderia cepacia]MBY4735433.1 hypothetical protein [Burkholderia cepacia]MBY4755853.1 hypothetical protein [Burkholderia cepacia]MBY4773362.1 hypothetical protein [Burkholderia cepacia]MBY4906046.1 hypothetical protein [Burkholderia cepacia]
MSPHAPRPAHAAERMHPAEFAMRADRERAMVKTGTDRHAEAAMFHPVDVNDRIEMVEMMEVVETIDEDEAHARADEKRRPPVPQVRIRVVHRRIP